MATPSFWLQAALRPPVTELLQLESCTLRRPGQEAPVFEDVSVVLRTGEKLAINGPSGCGKTTLALIIAGLLQPSSGRRLIMPLMQGRSDPIRMIFQDPFGAMNPRWRVSDWIRDNCPRAVEAKRIKDLCDRLLLPHELLQSYPLELSGGECQRFNLLIAVLGEPLLLILDEATSMVDRQAAEAMEEVIYSFTNTSALALVVIEHSAEEAAEALSLRLSPQDQVGAS
jgi:peptide/nickel transport system ATP-binding protein